MLGIGGCRLAFFGDMVFILILFGFVRSGLGRDFLFLTLRDQVALVGMTCDGSLLEFQVSGGIHCSEGRS